MGEVRQNKRRRADNFNHNNFNAKNVLTDESINNVNDKSSEPAKGAAKAANQFYNDKLSIVLSNCRGYRSKSGSVQKMMKSLKPDVLLLQETFLQAKEKVRAKGYLGYHRNRESDGRGGGIATLVSDRISPNSTAVGSGSGSTEMLSVRLENANPAITCISYYGCQEANRDEVDKGWEQIVMELSKAAARGDNIILLGDFNRKVGLAGGGDDARVSYGGKKILDLLQSGEFLLVNSMSDIVTGGPHTRVDPTPPHNCSVLSLVIVSASLASHVEALNIDSDRNFTPKRVRRTSNGFKVTHSDHFLLELRLNNLPSIPKKIVTRDWFFRKTNGWRRYKEETEKAAAKIKEIVKNNSNIEYIDRKLTKMQTSLLWKCFGKRTTKITGGEREEGCRSSTTDAEVSMYNLVKFEMAMEDLSRQESRIGKIWELRAMLNGKKKIQSDPPSAVIHPTTGELVCTVEGIKEATAEHVRLTLKDGTPIPAFSGVVLERELKHFRFMAEDRSHRMNLPKEIFDSVLYNMQLNNKPCYRLVTRSSEEYTDALYEYFVKLVESEKVPRSFSDTTLTQLHKKGNPSSLGNWRFIHMKSPIPRLFEACVTECLKPNLINAVSPYQLGGIAGNQPAQHLYVVKTVLASRGKSGLPTYISLFDMSKFFDRESAIDVCVTMHDIGCRGPMYRMFYRMCQFNNLTVKTPAGPTRKFEVGAIIPQGSSYAAICSSVNLDRALFKGFGEILGAVFSNNGLKMRPLSFQDDILKLSADRTETQLSQSNIYNIVAKKTLEFNLSKCSVIIHGSGMRSKMERAVYDENPVITGPALTPLVKSEKYLGDHLHERSLNDCWKETVKSRAPKVKSATAEIMAVVEDIKACNLQPVSIGLMLWNKVVLPSLLYNSNTWICMKTKDVGLLENLQYDFLRRLMRAPRNMLRAGLLWECGQWPLWYKVIFEKIMLYRHIINLPQSSLAKQTLVAEPATLEGLKFEVIQFCRTNLIPVPVEGTDKLEYRKVLKKNIDAVVGRELRAKIEASSTMHDVAGERFEVKNYITESGLGRARLIFSLRTSTTDRLLGNRFGTQFSRFCLCGKGYETSQHVKRCSLYQVCEVGLPDRLTNPFQISEYWGRIFALKARLGATTHRIQGGSPSVLSSATASPTTGEPTPGSSGSTSPASSESIT